MRALSSEEAAAIDTPHRVWGVDSEGRPLDLVPAAQAFAVVAGPVGPGLRLDLQAGEWVRDVPLDEPQAQALDQIDPGGRRGTPALHHRRARPAGRLRQQGAAVPPFRAGGYPADAVPPYVAAEIQAMGPGTTPQQAADSILAIADQWQGVLSPQIEQTRLKGKWAVQAAATAAAVQAAALSAGDALAAI